MFRVYGVQVAQGSDSEDEDEEQDDPDEEWDELNVADLLEQGEFEDILILPPHRRCASHTLSRVAVFDVENLIEGKDGQLKALHDSVMAKCRSVWNHQARSTLGHDYITEKMGTLFVVPNETRWNSKFDALKYMLDKVVSMSQQLKALFAEKKIEYFTANEIQWIREYVDVSSRINNSIFHGTLVLLGLAYNNAVL